MNAKYWLILEFRVFFLLTRCRSSYSSYKLCENKTKDVVKMRISYCISTYSSILEVSQPSVL